MFCNGAVCNGTDWVDRSGGPFTDACAKGSSGLLVGLLLLTSGRHAEGGADCTETCYRVLPSDEDG